MSKLYGPCKIVGMLTLAACFTGFPLAAQTSRSKAEVRSAQQQLKSDGYYSGAIDGIDGTHTQTAIRQFQKSKNLKVNGQLDQETENQLGVQQNGSNANSSTANNSSANMQNPNNQSAQATGNNSMSVPASTVEAAQRQLQQKGLYNGSIDGVMGQKTESAIRQFQQNNNLTASGQLDQSTLNKLGVSK